MTELIWDGKYKDGKKTAPVRIALPFQTIETVNESAADRQKNLELFTNNRQTEWRNRLIWGDKKYVLPSLLPEFAGKVNLIYIDPPFNVGADFSFKATIPDNPETEEDETIEFIKQPNLIEQKAYRDTWGKGLTSYLGWFYESASILRELLKDNGSIYVHLDYRLTHYIKVILDELFGYDNFRNQIIWKRGKMKGAKAVGYQYGRNHDTILLYSKSSEWIYNRQYIDYEDEYVQQRYTKDDNDGRGPYTDQPIGTRSAESLKKLRQEGRIFKTTGGTERVKFYLSDMPGIALDDVWLDIDEVNSMAKEKVGYATQKPTPLLERIIKVSSNENDIVLDSFAGSGTSAVAAEKLNRRWIACDLGRFAIHTTRKRLLGIENLKPFVVQNLGKYERQQWISAVFTSIESRMNQELSYRNFIIELYHAQPVTGYNWLHGSKAGRMIHIGSVDSPVSIGDVKSIIQEFWKIIGKSKDVQTNGIDIVGWDFAFEINETAKQYAAENKVDLKFKKIPREVLEKRAVEQGDIQFFELASLDVKTEVKGKDLTIKLNNFIIPPDDIPEEVRQAITHWKQCIDYWAVDWNYRDDTFHNQWQSYRTKKDPNIVLSTKYIYNEKGKYIVLVKVIDILGNDTTKAITINIK
jgi:adenine-specific DNA-methyltransferase